MVPQGLRRGSPQQEFFMRFMSLIKHEGPSANPPQAMIEAMGKLAEREIKAGRLLDTGGLMPVATGAQLKIVGGRLSVIDGPFVEAKEVVGGYAIFEFRDKEEALAMAEEFVQLHIDYMPGWEGTCEIRALIGPGEEGACQANVAAAHA
jgi:hypothetical protein